MLSATLAWAACTDNGGGSWTAADTSQTEVEACISSADAGNTITLPTGSSSWTSEITVNKALVLQGAGIASTIITGYGFAIEANDVHIFDIRFNLGGGSRFEIGESSKRTGFILSACYVQQTSDSSGTITFYNGSLGLVANNTFEIKTPLGGTGIYVFGSNDSDWTGASFFGEVGDYVFFEDNEFICSDNGSNNHCDHALLSGQGGSMVVRCNKFTNGSSSRYWYDTIDNHGYGEGSNVRSTRQMEAYGNKFTVAFAGVRTFQLRGGSQRVFANDIDYNGFTPTLGVLYMNENRAWNSQSNTSFPSDTDDCATNSSTSDPDCGQNNDSTYCCDNHEGYACCDQIGQGQDGYGGSRQQTIGTYFWDNTDGSSGAVSPTVSSSGIVSTFIQADRDYFSGAAPDGYSPYTYPHPDRGLSASNTCLDGDNSAADTGINFWTASGQNHHGGGAIGGTGIWK